MTQVRLFDGYEVQAEYLAVPGIKRKLALRRHIPEGTEPHISDEFEATIRFKLTMVPDAKPNNAGEIGEVSETWIAVPLEDSFAITAYVSRDQIEEVWRKEHGAA